MEILPHNTYYAVNPPQSDLHDQKERSFQMYYMQKAERLIDIVRQIRANDPERG